jgi:FkbM family methyltransferase
MRWSLQFLGQPQRNRSVIEVGANIGTTTIPLVTEYGAARVEAFEPVPGNVKLLRCNLILNDCEERVTVHRAAVSNYTGTLSMELSGHNAGDHRIITGDNTAPRPLWDDTPRQTVSVDSLQLRDFKTPEDLGLVWVDTQGHEARVLEGAPDFGVPWLIEYWPYALRRARGLEILNRQVSDRFSARVDVRASIQAGSPQFVTADGLEDLVERLGDREYTDLILIP